MHIAPLVVCYIRMIVKYIGKTFLTKFAAEKSVQFLSILSHSTIEVLQGKQVTDNITNKIHRF
jgi:hypothetical protein